MKISNATHSVLVLITVCCLCVFACRQWSRSNTCALLSAQKLDFGFTIFGEHLFLEVRRSSDAGWSASLLVWCVADLRVSISRSKAATDVRDAACRPLTSIRDAFISNEPKPLAKPAHSKKEKSAGGNLGILFGVVCKSASDGGTLGGEVGLPRHAVASEITFTASNRPRAWH